MARLSCRVWCAPCLLLLALNSQVISEKGEEEEEEEEEGPWGALEERGEGRSGDIWRRRSCSKATLGNNIGLCSPRREKKEEAGRGESKVAFSR